MSTTLQPSETLLEKIDFSTKNFQVAYSAGFDFVIGDIQNLHVGRQDEKCIFCRPYKYVSASLLLPPYQYSEEW
jgi:hypothetical protein